MLCLLLGLAIPGFNELARRLRQASPETGTSGAGGIVVGRLLQLLYSLADAHFCSAFRQLRSASSLIFPFSTERALLIYRASKALFSFLLSFRLLDCIFQVGVSEASKVEVVYRNQGDSIGFHRFGVCRTEGRR